jgi:hypothetical protein
VAWTNRLSIQGRHSPGVYLLACFATPPQGPADPQSEEIVDIGETCHQSLRDRLNQFNRTAFKGKFGSSAGKTYQETFGSKAEELYVAVFPVDGMEDHLRSLFIRHVERKLIWEYAQRWGQAPECNRK